MLCIWHALAVAHVCYYVFDVLGSCTHALPSLTIIQQLEDAVYSALCMRKSRCCAGYSGA